MSPADPTSTASPGYGRGVVYVLIAGVLWSTVGLGIRLVEDASVWQILLYRACSLTPFVFVVLWLRSGGKPFDVIRRAGTSSVLAGFALFTAYAGGVYSIQTTTVASALLIFASAPVFAAILGWLVLGETVRRATGVAILLAVIGVAIMVANGFTSGNIVGNLAALGGANGFAVYTVILRRGRATDMMPSVFMSGIATILISAPLCIALGLPLVISAHDATIALAMGIFQIGMGLVLYTLGSKTVPAAELTLLSLGEVLLAPVWVWLYMGEVPTSFTLIGGALLLAAIAGNALSGMKRRPVAISSVKG
ncbi:MAG: EamA family transporter [Hyphomicrobiales bacterium]|nr:EamA family transporter [Hyphomicrobiales bacterium]